MLIDMQKLVDAMGGVSRATRGRYQMTLGSIIEALKKVPQDSIVVFSDDNFSPGEAMSYRGYYSDLSFSPTEHGVKASDFLAECERALGKTFEGYKGGDFLMDEKTPLWISSYGSASGRAIMGVEESLDRVVLIIKTID